MISPTECGHRHRFFVCGGSAAGPGVSESHGVSICGDCGQFHVFKAENGHYATVEFMLTTDDQVTAAGQYVRYINQPEVNDGD